MTALEMAAQQGDPETAAALISSGAPVDEEDTDSGFTALDWAAFKNDIKLAAVLVTYKANVNHADKLGNTPLHWISSIDFRDTAMLEFLLRAGGAPLLQNKAGMTPLQLAIEHAHLGNRRALETAVASQQ